MSGEALEKKLGQSIAAARKNAGLTQQQLCAQAELSFSTLAKIERGAIKSPSVFTVQKIAAITNTTVEQLLGMSTSASVASSKRSSKSGVSFVYFDINGTLVRFFHQAFGKLAEASGVSSDVIEMTFWHYNDAICRGELSLEDFDVILAQKLGMPTVQWKEYYLASIEPIREMHNFVTWAANHYRIGLLSNIMPGFIDSLFQRGLLPDVNFDAIVDSSKVGAIKPEAKIYEIATSLASVPAEEVLLVDDSRANLMAAEHEGWHVLWFDDSRPAESIERIKAALEF